MTDATDCPSLKIMYHTFGCKLNFAETASVAEQFAARGHIRVAEGGVPDIIVINSCSVTAEADRKCRSTIRSLNRRYPAAAVVVTGCYAQLKPEEVAAQPGVRAVVGVNDKLDIPRIAEEAWLSGSMPPQFPEAKDLREFMPSCSRGDRTRFFLKVQDGCDYWCTYCTIPAARGRSRSGTIHSIVNQAREAAADGAKEIVITGVNIGDFGKRTMLPDGTRLNDSKETFLDLIRELDKVEGIERYRISSIEPNLLTDEIIEFCASSRAFMPHFHIPLQSGSDDVLRLMHRHYDTALFRHKIERIRELIPHAFIGVDLIVGARGETADEFARSRDFIESLPITRLHIFPYSERPGTKALEIGHTVAPDEKHRRVNEMLKLSERKMNEFASRFLGTARPVLLERGKAGHPMSGFTDNYLKVSVDAPVGLDNTIVNVNLVSLIPTEIGDCHVSATLADASTGNIPSNGKTL